MQHQTITRPRHTRPIAIEIDGQPLGVVVPSDEGYRFLAVRFEAFALDGRIFQSVDEARTLISAALQADQ
jgi:hypothetical protein